MSDESCCETRDIRFDIKLRRPDDFDSSTLFADEPDPALGTPEIVKVDTTSRIRGIVRQTRFAPEDILEHITFDLEDELELVAAKFIIDPRTDLLLTKQAHFVEPRSMKLHVSRDKFWSMPLEMQEAHPNEHEHPSADDLQGARRVCCEMILLGLRKPLLSFRGVPVQSTLGIYNEAVYGQTSEAPPPTPFGNLPAKLRAEVVQAIFDNKADFALYVYLTGESPGVSLLVDQFEVEEFTDRPRIRIKGLLLGSQKYSTTQLALYMSGIFQHWMYSGDTQVCLSQVSFSSSSSIAQVQRQMD